MTDFTCHWHNAPDYINTSLRVSEEYFTSSRGYEHEHIEGIRLLESCVAWVHPTKNHVVIRN